MYVCLCHGITVQQVEEAIAHGADSVALVRAATGAGSGCGGCISTVEGLVQRASEEGGRGRRLPIVREVASAA